MKKRPVSFFVSVLLTAGLIPGRLPDAFAQPNIILIMADDLGYETLACNGGQSYQTPQLDRLAREGTRFTNAYATPLCTPSRVQIMTGKYSFRNYERFGFLNPAEKTFANYLKDAGYQTAIAGKWQLGGDERTPAHFGFDQYCLWQLREGDFWYRYKHPRIVENGRQLPEKQTRGAYGPDIFTDFILRFITDHKNQPFFVYYPMVLTHDPFQPSPDHPEYARYQVEGLNDTVYFTDMVRYMDAKAGQIYRHLDSLGLLENTVLLFTGDNGTDRRVISRFRGSTIKGDKGYTTDAGTHVPLIVAGKGRVPAGEINDNLIDFTDFLPTLLQIAEIAPPDTFFTDGHGFWPQLTGEPFRPRTWIFCDYNPRGRDFPVRIYAQDTRYKLYTTGEFYRFVSDPSEIHSLDTNRLNSEALASYQLLKNVLARYAH